MPLLERINESLRCAVQVDESADVDNNIFSGGCPEGNAGCTFRANQHHSCSTIKPLNDYISGKLNWSFCVGICMGRVAMTGQLSGFTTWVKEVGSECESMHCVIHKEMLAS
ncbi:SCAN domain-containing protein 3 [Plecturocebus cupreus]